MQAPVRLGQYALVLTAVFVVAALAANTVIPDDTLVLWDVDRTLLYVGEIDRQVCREVFERLVGRPAEATTRTRNRITRPPAIRSLVRRNPVPEATAAFACCRSVLAHFGRVLRPGGPSLLSFHVGDESRLKTEG